MQIKITGKREWRYGDDVTAFVNHHHANGRLAEPDGVIVAFDSVQSGRNAHDTVHLTMSYTDVRLFAHRLLRTIGDRL